MSGINITYRDHTVSLQAGVSYPLAYAGEYWEVVKATGEIKLEFDQGSAVTRGAGCGGPASYRVVTITSPIDQTVRVSLGYLGGMSPYNARAFFDGTINADVAPITVQDPLADVAVPAGAQQLLAAFDPDRRELVIRWPSTASGPLRIGDSTTAANKGMELEPGDGYSVSGTAAIYGFNTGAAPASARLLAGKAP